MNEPITNKEQYLVTEEEPIPEEFKDLIIPNQNNISENNPNNLKPKVVISSNPQINNITMINKNVQVQNLNIPNKESTTTSKKNITDRKNNSSSKGFINEKPNPTYTNTNYNNNNYNISSITRATKSRSTLPNFDTSKFDNYNLEQMRYDLQKDYSYLHIDKDEEFLNRMQFDIYKRQFREDRINKLVEQSKVKIDEDERIKAFNRLILDANRRIEAQENMEKIKNKLEEDISTGIQKKYSDEEWKEIYNKRFKLYLDNINKKREENIKINMMKKINDENEEIKMCNIKKASQEHIDKEAQRMYDEAKKRKIKMDEKLRNINKYNYEDDNPSKYVKKIKSEAYCFLDDDDYNNMNNYKGGIFNEYYIGKNNNYKNPRQMKKKKGMAVSEFNNKRFDKRQRMGKSCSNININNKNNSKNIKPNEILPYNNNFNHKNNPSFSNNNYNIEEERNNLIQMANMKLLKQMSANDLSKNDGKNKFQYKYNKDNHTSGVSEIIDQFCLRNINNSNNNIN